MKTVNHRHIIIWLLSVCALVVFMVFVGGVTRLTDSGLSMVQWKPILGAIPPLDEQSWIEAFNMYKQYPEYQKVNMGMTLSEFKYIYFWEYFHRITGRLIGIVFFFPFVFFLIRGSLSKSLKIKLLIALILGGLQGLMGWYMVKSGLVDRPDVSHYRLAAHLSLAFIILGYISWIIFELRPLRQKSVYSLKSFSLLMLFFFFVCVQIVYGAFVAGLDAGIGYNTFPLMNGSFVPKQFWFLSPLWSNFFENSASIQFIHRTMGWVIFIFSFLFWFSEKKKKRSYQQHTVAQRIFLVVILQFLLGVSTLLLHVPVWLASMHQLGACLLFIMTIRAIYIYGPSASK